VHPVSRPRVPAPALATAPLVADGRRWSWDIAHNPDPLSVAQAELVEAVDRARIAPWSLRVCAGFLYAAPRTDMAQPDTDAVLDDPAQLMRQVAAIEARLARTLEVPPGSVEAARAGYLAFYEIWANELSSLIAAVRRRRPARSSAGRASSVEASLLAAARGELTDAEITARLGILAPAWDVAVATYAEQPGVLDAAIARSAALGSELTRRGPTAAVVTDRDQALSSLIADLGERDDWWFARAQWLVRAALLARGRELGLDEGDVFWLPSSDLALGPTPEEARRRSRAAQAAAARAARWDMPLVVGGTTGSKPEPLRGVGSGAVVTGRVVRFATLGSAIAAGPGDVVVTRAVTPALAVLVVGCAALISETGGLLDHGAALARELGIPCVVGCHDAWTLLDDGMVVTVDGDHGVVTTSSA
jgi:phosphohistidine swiveling domain-containing protein